MNEQISIRAIEPEDLDLLYTIENDMTLWDIASSGMHLSKFALKKYITEQPADIFQAGELRLIIELNHRYPIGIIDLTNFTSIDRRAEIGIAILNEYRNKGFASEAILQIEKYAKEQLRIELLYAQISSRHNLYCKKLFLNLGYNEIAILPEWHFRNNHYEDISILSKKIAERNKEKQ